MHWIQSVVGPLIYFFSLTFITKAFRNAKPDMRLAKVKDHTSLEYINMQKCDDILGITGSF